MVQIIAVCKEADIPLLASFQLDDDREAADVSEDGRFLCSTVILPPDAARELKEAEGRIFPRLPHFRITTTHSDGSRDVEEIVVL